MNCFSRSTPELSLPQVASRLGIPKPTTFRILANLVRHGWLEYNGATNIYALGFASLRFADALLHGIDIRAPARPAMQGIRDAVNETVILSVRDGDSRINVDSVESTQAIAQTLQLGVRIPLYAGAASQVFLAAMADEDIADYLARTELRPFNTTTLTDAAEIGRRIAKIRKQGFAVSYGEFTATGGSAIAVPIRDGGGSVAAALHVSGPKGRLTPELQKRCLEALLAGSAAVTEALRRAPPLKGGAAPG